MALCSQEHGALIPFFLLIGWISVINILCLLNYLLMLAQIEAICIHKEPFICFLLSSLFSILNFLFVTFLTFSFFFLPFCLVSHECPGRSGRREEGQGQATPLLRTPALDPVRLCLYLLSPLWLCTLLQTSIFSLRYGHSKMGPKDGCEGWMM